MATHWHNVVGGNRGSVGAASRSSRLLEPLGDLYGEVVRFRNFCYDRQWVRTYWLDVPVIAVGNLTTGGTGKTPMVIFLAKLAASLGHRPGVVLRGYGRKDGREADEVLLLRRALPGLPVVVNADRVAAGREAIAAGATLVIADDAFQHRRLGRDLNICLIDACFPFGGERMLPAGRLREPLDGLERADLVILTRCEQAGEHRIDAVGARIRELVGCVPCFESRHRPCTCMDGLGTRVGECGPVLAAKNVFGFAAIARPDAFFETVRAAGGNLAGTQAFRDHHYYSVEDLRQVWGQASVAGVEYLVCTAKDLVKIDAAMMQAAGIEPRRVLAVEIEMDFSDADRTRLQEKMAEACSRVPRI